VVEGEEILKDYITKYYKDLFGASWDSDMTLNESMVKDMLTSLEREELMAEFAEKEVRETIFGFPAEFYQVFWSLIKDDLMDMFRDFHSGDLPLFCLNFGVITLIPKEKEVKRIQQYRPICMLNVSFKIFTKVMANRLELIACRITKPSQSAFLPGRYILEGVVVLHETLHELKRKKHNGLILKLDFEKAYDKVNWKFLQQVLRMREFPSLWCQWVENVVSKGSVCVHINDELGHLFQSRKGLRQEDPLSPMLFNLVADMLAVLIERAKNLGFIDGLVPHLVDDGLSILQYAEPDTNSVSIF
jgi:hypothetical protein